MKKIKAYAVLCGQDELVGFGNGKQSQLPIFPTRKDAREWRQEDKYNRGKIVPCTIVLTDKRS